MRKDNEDNEKDNHVGHDFVDRGSDSIGQFGDFDPYQSKERNHATPGNSDRDGNGSGPGGGLSKFQEIKEFNIVLSSCVTKGNDPNEENLKEAQQEENNPKWIPLHLCKALSLASAP